MAATSGLFRFSGPFAYRGILRIPLDTISFQVKDCVKVASHKHVNLYHEFTISFGVGMAK